MAAHGWKPSAFTKTILRAIRSSLGRFLAIVGIVALGCGFFAGLQMCGQDMRSFADEFYTSTDLYDLRLVSSMGLTDKDVERVSSIDGVTDVMPSTSCDVIARLGSDQVAVRLGTVDSTGPDSISAAAGQPFGNVAALNQVFLRSGRWPNAADECVVTSDVSLEAAEVGDTMEVLYGTSDLEDVLRTRKFRIVGTVSSSNYPYVSGFGSTTLGSGLIEFYAYVTPKAFVDDMPYTEIYLRVPEASSHMSGSTSYQRAIVEVTDRIEGLSDLLSYSRLDDIRSKAQRELDDNRATFERDRSKALGELDDAKSQLADAADELANGERELLDGTRQYEDGVATYQQQRQEATTALNDAQKTIDDALKDIEAGAKELDKAAKEAAQGRAELNAGIAQLTKQTGTKDLASAKAYLQSQLAQAKDAQPKLEEARDGARQLVAGQEELARQKEKLEASRETLQAGTDQLLAGLAAQGLNASSAEEAVAILQATIEQIQQASVPEVPEEPAEPGDPEAPGNTEGSVPGEQTTGKENAEGTEGAPSGSGQAGYTAMAESPTGIEETLATLQAALAQAQQLVDGKAQLEAGEQELQAAQAQLDAGEQKLLAGLASQGIQASSARKAVAAIDAQIKTVKESIPKLADALDAVAELEAAQAKLDAGEKEIAQNRTKLDDARVQASDGQSQLNDQKAQAEREFANAQAQLDDAKAQLDSGAKELASGRVEYEDGMATYLSSEAEAHEKLADAEQKLDDAQKDIDDIEAPDIYTLGRDKNEGVAAYQSDSERMDSIANVFPLIFFLVAALVSLTTMTRMVEDDRVLIGTYKALGYSKVQIAGKYLAYAGAASASGATLGILLLSQALPLIVTSSYGTIYTVPAVRFPMPIDLPIALMAGGLGVGVTLIATWAAVSASLRETPSTLMLPRAPAAGKRILLERITPLWRKMSFSWKVTFRNLFRYKRRMFMTVIGISGCTALLLVGYGVRDAIWDIIACQYGPIIHYDTTVTLNDDANETDVEDALEELHATGLVDEGIRVHHHNMQAGIQSGDDTMRVQVVVPRNAQELQQAVTLHERLSQRALPFDDDAVILTEKLATRYGIEAGDEVLLFDQDDIGNVVGDGHRVTVTGVAENYLDHLVYLGRNAWKHVSSENPAYATIYLTCGDDEDVHQTLSNMLNARGDVSTVSFARETVERYREMLTVVDFVVVVLIVSAAALAFIVLYNLTNINVEERVREIASLKVLGFTKREVYTYIFREILLLSALGDLLGMVLGSFLATFVVTTAEIDYVMFGRTIHPLSYVYAFTLTMVFSVLILLGMRRKLDRVNMVESLKSVD